MCFKNFFILLVLFCLVLPVATPRRKGIKRKRSNDDVCPNQTLLSAFFSSESQQNDTCPVEEEPANQNLSEIIPEGVPEQNDNPRIDPNQSNAEVLNNFFQNDAEVIEDENENDANEELINQILLQNLPKVMAEDNPDAENENEQQNNNDNQADSAELKKQKKLMKKWEKEFEAFEFDYESLKVRCKACSTVEAKTKLAKWCDIIFKNYGTQKSIKAHLGLMKNRVATTHTLSLSQVAARDPEVAAAIMRGNEIAKKQMIEKLDNAENVLTHDEKDAKVLLELAIFIAKENLAIIKFVPLKKLITKAISLLKENPQMGWSQISRKFSEFLEEIKKIEDEGTRRNLLLHYKELKQT